MPDFCFTKHASEVVCVSIGANLLLPIASTILLNLLSGINTEPTEIVRDNFTNQNQLKFITDSDLRKIGKCASRIDCLRDSCKDKHCLRSLVLDFFSAFAGLFLLWSGWVDNERIAPYCVLLCLPPAWAVVPPFIHYLYLRIRLSMCIKLIGFRTILSGWIESRNQGKEKSSNNIDDFVSAARNELERKRK